MDAWVGRDALLALEILLLCAGMASCQSCSEGFYKTSKNICCKLCRAGFYKEVDCTENGKDAFCLLCPRDQFMETENHATSCNPCMTCGKDENTKVPCTMMSDTQCRCKEGLQWNPESKSCGMTDAGMIVGPVMVVGLLFLIVTLAYTTRYMWKIRGYRVFSSRESGLPSILTMRNTTESIPLLSTLGHDRQTPAYAVLQNKKADLQRWLKVNPGHLLDHLDSNSLISRSFYNKVCGSPPDECVDLLVGHFTEGREEKCRILLCALFDVRKTYTNIWSWLLDSDRDVKRIIVEGKPMRAVRSKKVELKQWLGSNPAPLVAQLQDYGFLADKDTGKCTDGAEWALHILNLFIDRGDEGCEKLLFTLKVVQSHYPHLNKWLHSLGFFVDILYKSPLFVLQRSDAELSSSMQMCLPTLIRILQKDVQGLQNYLLQQHLLNKDELWTAEGTEMMVSVTLQQILRKHPNCARRLWEIVWSLRDSHPTLTGLCLSLSL